MTMASPEPHRPRFQTPAGFGPPAGFAMPGGPKLPGASGPPRTRRPIWLSAAATVFCFPLGLAALVLALLARSAADRGEVDEARVKLRRASAVAWAAIALGVIAWVAALLAWEMHA
jgi:hypothetical protein